jgi:diguanylate cyclase (GGDEF)-like protein
MLEMVGKLATISIEHHHTTRQLAHLVEHDALTGLPNRILLEDRLQHALASARRKGTLLALCAIDLDHFKSINDNLGHQAGDSLLQQFSHRIQSLLRQTDTLARIGGDEFLLLLPDLATPDGAAKVARTILDALADPFTIEGNELVVTGSIGIAVAPRDGTDIPALHRSADAAMYVAKRRGRNGFATLPEHPPATDAA